MYLKSPYIDNTFSSLRSLDSGDCKGKVSRNTCWTDWTVRVKRPCFLNVVVETRDLRMLSRTT